MPRLKMHVVPEPDAATTTIFDYEVLPGMKGEGPYDWICGSCETVLLEGLFDRDQVRGVVHRCPVCKAYNQIERPAKREPIH